MREAGWIAVLGLVAVGFVLFVLASNKGERILKTHVVDPLVDWAEANLTRQQQMLILLVVTGSLVVGFCLWLALSTR